MHAMNRLNRRNMVLCSGFFVAGLSQRKVAIGQNPHEKDVIFRTTDPRNAEPQLDDLVQSWITPIKHFYIRSHAPNPVIDPATFALRVEGMVKQTLSLSLAALQEFQEHAVTVTLTCAGNRRAEFNKQREVGGVQWEAGAIGNAVWTGVKLSDVLRQAQVQDGARHVWFEGLDQVEHNAEIIPFGGSIPIEKAMDSGEEIGALLVYKMNGDILAADHGYPLRTIVPGYIGARSVKWLGRVVVSDQPSPNHFVATAYKLVQDSTDLDWSEAGPIYRYPINAAIAAEAGLELAAGPVSVKGYVLPSGMLGAKIRRVQLSADSGKTWTTAELSGEVKDYCWQLWTADVEVGAATTELIVRATDTSGNFMPAQVPWNAKGYMQNAWYRLPVKVN